MPVVSVSDLIAETDDDGVIMTLCDFSYQTSMLPGLDLVPDPYPVPRLQAGHGTHHLGCLYRFPPHPERSRQQVEILIELPDVNSCHQLWDSARSSGRPVDAGRRQPRIVDQLGLGKGTAACRIRRWSRLLAGPGRPARPVSTTCFAGHGATLWRHGPAAAGSQGRPSKAATSTSNMPRPCLRAVVR